MPPERAGAGDPGEHFERGRACQDAGRTAEAVAHYLHAVALDPACGPAHYNLGLILHEQGRFEEAAAAFARAAPAGPHAAAALNNQGVALQALGRTAEALASYAAAARQDPRYAPAPANAGRLLFAAGRWAEAEACFRRAAAADPRSADHRHHLGLCRHKLRDLDGAERCYAEALALEPSHRAAHVDMGNVWLDRGDRGAMAAWYRRALALEAAGASDYVNVGRMFQDAGRDDEALACYAEALARDADHAAAHFGRAQVLLARGDFPAGWPEYEWRFRLPDWRRGYPHRLAAPRWHGARFDGRTLLVHCEQGLGDAIQFARYLPRVKARGGTVILEAPEPLKRLFERLPGVDALTAFSGASPPACPHDLQVPLLSLPGIFGTTISTIPAEVPYLRSAPEAADRFRRRLEKGAVCVGIVWAASGWTRGLAAKSCRLVDFDPLAGLRGVALYGLQKGAAAAEAAACPPAWRFENWGEAFADLADTAAAVAALDLVVSVDTAVAHLAGAMGKPVWVLLPFCADWRWLRDRSESPWYPTMRLFRQEKNGDWAGVFMRVRAALRSRLPAR
jgi:tetratricopeptide (TPR) repeat protein